MDNDDGAVRFPNFERDILGGQAIATSPTPTSPTPTSPTTTILNTTGPTMTIPTTTSLTTTSSRPVHEDALRASVAQVMTGELTKCATSSTVPFIALGRGALCQLPGRELRHRPPYGVLGLVVSDSS